MCGIAGVISNNYKFSDIEKITKGILHRGREKPIYKKFSNGTFSHIPLNIVAKSSFQPFVKDNCILTYNGEIYNYKEYHCENESQTDTEIMMKLYLEYGIDFVVDLSGEFACAIYNDNQKVLHLTRDRFGIKPLYYCYDAEKDFFCFASEIKAILQVIKPEYCERTFNKDFNVYNCQISTDTFFKGIKIVMPGTIITFKNGKITSKKYFTFNDLI